MGSELFHADGRQTGRYDEANGSFSRDSASALNPYRTNVENGVSS